MSVLGGRQALHDQSPPASPSSQQWVRGIIACAGVMPKQAGGGVLFPGEVFWFRERPHSVQGLGLESFKNKPRCPVPACWVSGFWSWTQASFSSLLEVETLRSSQHRRLWGEARPSPPPPAPLPSVTVARPRSPCCRKLTSAFPAPNWLLLPPGSRFLSCTGSTSGWGAGWQCLGLNPSPPNGEQVDTSALCLCPQAWVGTWWCGQIPSRCCGGVDRLPPCCHGDRNIPQKASLWTLVGAGKVPREVPNRPALPTPVPHGPTVKCDVGALLLSGRVR